MRIRACGISQLLSVSWKIAGKHSPPLCRALTEGVDAGVADGFVLVSGRVFLQLSQDLLHAGCGAPAAVWSWRAGTRRGRAGAGRLCVREGPSGVLRAQ